MKYKTFYLNFNSPLHLGNYKPEGYEQSEVFLRSDTIIAAVMSVWAMTGQQDLINKYLDNSNSFSISSAFPFVKQKSGEILHFFPRLKLKWNIDYNPDLGKKMKKIIWLDKNYFEKVISYDKLDNNKEDFENALKDEFLTNKSPEDKIYNKEIQERVKIPRDISQNKDSSPFYMERIRFADTAGLFFLAVGEMIDELKKGLEILQYEGFGTDRAVGNGYFELSKSESEIELKLPENGQYSTNLGLFCPESKEQLSDFLGEKTSFSILKRGGWVTMPGYRTLRKNSIYMFEEGSVFNGKKDLAGKKEIDLTPGIMKQGAHKILRTGKTIFVPVNL